MDPDAIVAIASGGGGAITVLSFFIVMFIRGWIHADPAYQDLKEDRNYWRSVADRALTANEKFATPVDVLRKP